MTITDTHMMTDEGGQRFDRLIKRHLGTKKEERKKECVSTHTQSERGKFDEKHSGSGLNRMQRPN